MTREEVLRLHDQDTATPLSVRPVLADKDGATATPPPATPPPHQTKPLLSNALAARC